MNNRKWLAAAARSLVFLTQLGFSMLLPPVAALLGAWYLQEKQGWGGWVWPVAIVLGLAMGASSFAEFARYMQKEARDRPLTDWEDTAAEKTVGRSAPKGDTPPKGAKTGK